jgi:hypothetical protein
MKCLENRIRKLEAQMERTITFNQEHLRDQVRGMYGAILPPSVVDRWFDEHDGIPAPASLGAYAGIQMRGIEQ